LLLCVHIIKSGFPNSFQILCYNCNNGKRMNRGVCPHQEFNVLTMADFIRK
jgi:hypothetical protein